MLAAGDHMVLPVDLYGGTYRLVDKVLDRFGLARPRRPARPRRGARRDPARDPDGVGGDADQPAAQRDRHRRRRRGGRGVPVVVDNTSRPRSSSARSSWRDRGRPLDHQVPRRPFRRRRRRGDHRATRAARADPLRPERGRGRARAARLLPCPPRASHLALRVAQHTANGRAVSEFLAGARERGRAVAGVRRHGLVPPPRRRRDRRPHRAVLARRVAGRRRVADRGAAGDDPSVGRGLGGRGPAGPGPALVRIEAADDLVADLRQALSG